MKSARSPIRRRRSTTTSATASSSSTPTPTTATPPSRVGTYLGRNSKSVHLHGEDHLRQVADTFDSPAQAMLAFEKVHGAEMRPSPAPLTDTERAAAEARGSVALPAAKPEPARQEPETVPAYLADAGDHDALLNAFLDAHGDREKWRTWSDETTHAIHESQTLRIERVHETPAHETAWTVAAYETPVSDRMWVLTATGATPAPVIEELLNHLADGDGWESAIGAPVEEKMVTAATQPLSDAGWKHTVDGRWIRWTSPEGDAGVQFDAFTAQHPSQNLATWTVWVGPDRDGPTWAVTASPHTPSALLADRSETLVHETGLRRPQPGTQDEPHHQPVSRSRGRGQPFTLILGTQERGNIARDRRLAKPAIPRIIGTPPPRPTRTSKGIPPRPQSSQRPAGDHAAA
ncbi:DUF317 domain-containing protein [Streptomyces coerulescens]|uniref:DUF317 domain-containing protein n=1 Tax=Streptomyces coerulescens TaxID=29304 RepID=A0ABW0CU33_STRCD